MTVFAQGQNRFMLTEEQRILRILVLQFVCYSIMEELALQGQCRFVTDASAVLIMVFRTGNMRFEVFYSYPLFVDYSFQTIISRMDMWRKNFQMFLMQGCMVREVNQDTFRITDLSYRVNSLLYGLVRRMFLSVAKPVDKKKSTAFQALDFFCCYILHIGKESHLSYFISEYRQPAMHYSKRLYRQVCHLKRHIGFYFA